MTTYLPLAQLNQFFGKAAAATYAGNGPRARTQRSGFKEMEYRQGDWKYRDSYSGFTQSWGQEVIWRRNAPIWTQVYGGGMEPKHRNNPEYATAAFVFLKKALSTGEKQLLFQPRGPRFISDNEYEYACEWNGDIKKFKGHEKIIHKGEIIFTHDFFGGLVTA